MKVIFLGSQGSLQSERSGNVSLIVTDERSVILVDTSGAPAQLIRQAGYDPLSLDVLVLTHSHIDHLYALPSLLHNLWLLKRTKALLIVANSQTIRIAKRLCSVFELDKKPKMFPIEWSVGGTSREFGPYGSLSLRLFPVDHGVPTCGLLCTDGVSRFVYSADTRPLSADSFPGFIDAPDILVHEAGGVLQDEVSLYQGGHCSGRQAAHCAMKLHAKRLILCHLPLAKEKQDAILTEASSVFPHTELPVLFAPYDTTK